MNFKTKKIILILVAILTLSFIPQMSFATSKTNSKSTQIEEIPAEFGPYMRKMQMNIKKNWNPPKYNKNCKIVAIYKIQQDGKISNIRIKKSSGDKNMDNSAIKALKKSSPLSPLPYGFKEKSVDVEFSFDYNMKKNN